MEEEKDNVNKMLKELSSKDLISSLVLIGASIFVIIISLRMRVYRSFLDAPAIFPITVASIIGLLNLFLLIDSIKRGGLQEIMNVWEHRKELLYNNALQRIIIISFIIIIYGFFLVRHMHFTIATFIFLSVIMAYLKINWLHIILVSTGVSLIISFVFGTLFNIPLP